jgi:hypothetical protein
MSDPESPSEPPRTSGPEDGRRPGGDPPGLPGRPPSSGRSPVFTLIIWLVVLFALPLLLWTFKQQSRRPVQELAASDFENILDAGRVRSAIVVRDPSTGTWIIHGAYVPETSGKNAEVKELKYRVQVAYTDALDKMLRERCPLWPLVLVPPRPEPLPRPMRFFLSREPSAYRSELKSMVLYPILRILLLLRGDSRGQSFP